MPRFHTGWLPELEEAVQRGALFRSLAAERPFQADDSPIPESFSLSKFRLFPQNQGNAGTCWSNAAVQIMQIMTAVEVKTEGKTWELCRLSRRFVSYYGKIADGTHGNPDDGGTIGAALVAMSGHIQYGRGCAHEDLWPYPKGNQQEMRMALAKTPPGEAQTDATSNRVTLVSELPTSLGEPAQRSILNGNPVGIGFPWPSSFDTIGATAFTKTGGYDLRSGHAVVLIGWMKREGLRYWQIENSHGPIYAPLPPLEAGAVPGYSPVLEPTFGFPGTYDFWVLEEVLLELMAQKWSTATIAAGLDGFEAKPQILSFLEAFE